MISEEQLAEARKGIYVVKDGGAIRWPDKSLRGRSGYVVHGNDPHMNQYWVNGIPAMLVRDDSATPVPPSDWPRNWRAAAGEEYLTAKEVQEAEEKAAVAAEKKKAEDEKKQELASRVSSEIPGVDES